VSLLQPGPEGCSCLWVGELEFWAGDPVTVWSLREKDRRCLVHGKPRHAARANTLRKVKEKF